MQTKGKPILISIIIHVRLDFNNFVNSDFYFTVVILSILWRPEGRSLWKPGVIPRVRGF